MSGTSSLLLQTLLYSSLYCGTVMIRRFFFPGKLKTELESLVEDLMLGGGVG